MAEVHLALANLSAYATWEFHKFEPHIKRSIELNPNLSLTHYSYSWVLFLFGRNEEAIAEHELAQKYDPFNPICTSNLGALYTYLGRHEDAIREANKSLEMFENYPFGLWAKGEAYLALGENEKAVQAIEKLVNVAPEWVWYLGYIYAMTGHREKAEGILVQLESLEINNWFAMGLAVLYGALGRKDEAFKWIEYKPHHMWIPWVAVMPMWKPLHGDPRHARFVKHLNLP